MIERQIAPTLLRLADSFPVLAITGPRQSGKTTLARHLFPGKPYISLEDPTERAFAAEDPRGFLGGFQRALFSMKLSAGLTCSLTFKAWWMKTARQGVLF